MDVHPTESAPMPPRAMPSTRPSVVVLTSVEGTLCRGSGAALDDVREALQFLERRGVPVVLISRQCAAHLAALRDSGGAAVPFVADGGASLYIPEGYFGGLPGFGRDDGAWTVVECARTRRTEVSEVGDAHQAVRLLVSLYRRWAAGAVTVGVGSSWDDWALLREVDVPVIVRRDDVEQERLRAAFPQAYVTAATGPAGWSEAMLGAPDV